MEFTPDEQAGQLRKPHGEGAPAIFNYMNRGNKQLYTRCLSELDVKSGIEVLEIGQGNGVLVSEILGREEDIRYSGLDYSPDSVAAAIELNRIFVDKNRAHFYEGQIGNMPFKSSAFDRVLGVNTIYFWENPLVELKEILRVLKPGSFAVFGYRPKSRMSALPFARHGFIHYDPADFEFLLHKAGFHKISSSREKENDRNINGDNYPMENIVTIAEKPISEF